MTASRVYVLGAPDPEMEAIKRLLRDAWEQVAYAAVEDPAAEGGYRRVTAAEAYRGRVALGGVFEGEPVLIRWTTGDVVYVECAPLPGFGGSSVTVVDHHRPGDPGYGRLPAEYLEASSLGQVLRLLGVEPTDEHRIIAAADHCLAAAYRGECPGVDPDALMQWRIRSRAAFQGRPVDEVLADVEAARKALREAPLLELAPGLFVRDMRGRHVPELPEASAREGVCFVADGLPGPDGRTKVVCQSGSPDQIRAFMEAWGPANGLQDIYGDPARGFAGGFTG